MYQRMSETNRPVLVVGAGPVGLTLATELTRRGVAVTCIDKAEAPSVHSKALLVWPRTLQVLRGLGGADAIARRGLAVDSFRYYSSARQIARIGFTDRTKPVVLPQPDVESLLGQALNASGGKAEWGTELTSLVQEAGFVRVALRSGGRETEEEFSYVVGCDGASSSVRSNLGLTFEGATYPNSFMLADARVTGPLQPDAVHYYCSPRGVLVMIALPNGRFRVFTSAPPDLSAGDATLDMLQEMVDQRGPRKLLLHDSEWTSTFAVHARHAERYRVGRVFLAGDAAHIHSPAGGQGLNTGVTDANNLAWKLALTWHGHADEALLATYETERAQVAQAVVRQADLQMKAWLISKPIQVRLRDSAVRVASATGLFARDYVPWLAGLRTTYQTGAVIQDGTRNPARIAEHRFAAGALVPDQPVRPDKLSGSAPLQTLISDLHHTLLIDQRSVRDVEPIPFNAVADVLDSLDTDIIQVRVIEADGLIGLPRRATTVPRGSQLILLRPDRHIAAQATAADPTPIVTYLTRFLNSTRRKEGST